MKYCIKIAGRLLVSEFGMSSNLRDALAELEAVARRPGGDDGLPMGDDQPTFFLNPNETLRLVRSDGVPIAEATVDGNKWKPKVTVRRIKYG